MPTYDTMGAGAVEHIESFFTRKSDKRFEKNLKYAVKVKEYWDSIKAAGGRAQRKKEKVEKLDIQYYIEDRFLKLLQLADICG